MSNKRKIKRQMTSRQVDSWSLQADTPGLSATAPPAANPMFDMILLGQEAEAHSTAVRTKHDGVWEPTVICRVKGRYNGTDHHDEFVISWPAAVVEEIATSMIEAAKAAMSDAAAESLKAQLGWSEF
jgi:hypothetical protein